LLAHFIRRISKREGIPAKSVSPEAMEALRSYPWPGNVRELENTAEQLMAITVGNEIRKEHLSPRLTGEPVMTWPARDAVLSGRMSLTDAVQEFERDTIQKALAECEGNKTKAAERLGITRRMLSYKLSQDSSS
jgi:DNA-binding NtrC family response regulator